MVVKMQNNKYSKIALLALAFSHQAAYASPDHVKADGGIEIYRSEDNNYWFSMHGVVKLDAVAFPDNYKARRDEFPSGTNLRAVENSFGGGIGEDLSFSVSLSFENGVSVSDAYFTYSGIDNMEFNIGQVISPFCLENANSGKWIPFLERSLPIVAFAPCMGIGGQMVQWSDHHAIILSTTTPLAGTNRDTPNIKHRSDNITSTARFVYAPINCHDKVLQFGLSGVYAENSPTFRDGSPNTDGRRFSTRPEARARNTPQLINSGNMMEIDNYNEWGAELSGQYGPLVVQSEYLQANVHRGSKPTLNFYGWHTQASYVLTGEHREHKMKSGSFGKITPKCKYGAWEVAARYSMVNLNDEDIHGGKENNVSLALNWYVNNNLLIRTNYIYASIDPTQALGNANNPNPAKRHMNIIGTRAQIVW
tara:strand:- start:842 stop:2104 length:1263 start_codon:yes stop_codon:yes gene_type:complete